MKLVRVITRTGSAVSHRKAVIPGDMAFRHGITGDGAPWFILGWDEPKLWLARMKPHYHPPEAEVILVADVAEFGLKWEPSK